jgi:hypothetical protein
MATRWDTTKWDQTILDEINVCKDSRRKKDSWKHPIIGEPIYGLYLLASKTMSIIRPGAIGIDRVFNQCTLKLEDAGNSAFGRFNNYHQKNSTPKYPWKAWPWRYVWLVNFNRELLSIPELHIAEQMLHFHMVQAGFKYVGGSCHECDKDRLEDAIHAAESALARFQGMAPALFETLPPATPSS